MRNGLIGAAACLAAALSPALADPQSGKFHVEGDTLFYDSDTPAEGEEPGITRADVDLLLEYLRTTEGVTRLQLRSSGGSIYPARMMSDILVDFELDTHVDGDCDSSCIIVFLGGKTRTMSRGSRLGFHQTYWAGEDIKGYYEREAKAEGWATPWDFAAWIYTDTQSEVYAHLSYMVARGVDPDFAIESIRDPGSAMWRPYRKVLLKAGVLTE